MPQVFLFGGFSDRTGWSQRTVEARTLGEVRDWLSAEAPDLAERLGQRSTLVIVNHTLLPFSARPDDLPLADSDEVAFGPPVSGG